MKKHFLPALMLASASGLLFASTTEAYTRTYNCEPYGLSQVSCSERTYPGQREDELSALRSALQPSSQLSGVAYLRKLLQDGLDRQLLRDYLTQQTQSKSVPTLSGAVKDKVNQEFQVVFSRQPNEEEQTYWAIRVQAESLSNAQLKNKMRFYQAQGKTTGLGATTAQVAGASTSSIGPKINSIFRSVYGRNPSPSENHYWLTRITDKPTEAAMAGAMAFHKANGINH